MTTQEAREIYLNSDCSYFIMCTRHYSSYIQYRRLELTKEQENIWRNEKMQMLCAEIRKNGDYHIFERLYEIAFEFRDYERMRLLLDALKCIKLPLEPDKSIRLASIILGRKSPKVRSGMIYWAFDIKQRAIAIILMDLALELLNFPDLEDEELVKRICRERRLCKRIIAELNLNFSNRYLKHYYDF